MIKNIEKILEYPYKFKNTLAPFTIMILVFYGGIAAPKLPKFILKLFKMPIFRILILSLIVYKGNSNPTLSIIVAIGFVLIMDKLRKKETFDNTVRYIQKSNNSSKVTHENFVEVDSQGEDQQDDEDPTFDCEIIFPMPNRQIADIVKKPDGTCKVIYFNPPGTKPDCSICANSPDKDKTVIECQVIATNGFCEYEYEPEEDLPESEHPDVNPDDIENPFDEDTIMSEIAGLFEELETMKALNDIEVKKIDELKTSQNEVK